MHRSRGSSVFFSRASLAATAVMRDVSRLRSSLDSIQNNIRNANRLDQVSTCEVLSKSWLAEHPDDISVLHMLAESLYQMARYEESLQLYNSALVRFPDHQWGIFNQIGHLYRYRGELDQAAVWYEKAIEDDPDEASSYIFLGAIKARQGKLAEAEQIHRKATSCSNGLIEEAFHNLGLVLRGQTRLSEAADCFRRAIKIDSGYNVAIEALEDVVHAQKVIQEQRG